MKKTVNDFYEEFNFEKIITGNLPRSIQEFLDKEILYLQDKIRPAQIILEIGCGYGRLLKVLAKKSKRVVGIDFSKALLKKAKENLIDYKNIELIQMNAQELKFPDNLFDYVLCLDNSFGNMPDIEQKVLNEMARVCKLGGKIIVSVFSENAKDVQIENYKRIGLTNITDDGVAIHTEEGMYSRRFSKKDIKELFGKIRLHCHITKICSVNYFVVANKKIKTPDTSHSQHGQEYP